MSNKHLGEKPSEKKPFGWAFAGTGAMARNAAGDILKDGGHKIVSVYNRTFSRGVEFAREVGANAYQSLNEAVLADGVEGVYISPVNTAHFEYAKTCLELGKPVLLEKPFTVDRASAEALISLAKSKGVYLCEAMWTWFPGAALKVREWVNGSIGAVKSARFAFKAPLSHVARLTDPNAAGGALLDLGVYPITYCAALFGKPARVECAGYIDGGVDIRETVKLYYDGGLCAVCESSIDNGELECEARIVGESGEIYSPGFSAAGEAVLIIGSSKESFSSGGGYLREFDAAAAEIRGGLTESAYCPFERTLAVMEIMDECRSQMGLKYPFEV